MGTVFGRLSVQCGQTRRHGLWRDVTRLFAIPLIASSRGLALIRRLVIHGLLQLLEGPELAQCPVMLREACPCQRQIAVLVELAWIDN